MVGAAADGSGADGEASRRLATVQRLKEERFLIHVSWALVRDFFFSCWFGFLSRWSVLLRLAGGSITVTVGRLPLPSHAALFSRMPRALRRGLSP